MSFANTIFQKDIYDIKLSDVESFFSDEQEENAILEFKSGGVEIEAICREVCAFLNSEGGLLIIGSPREQTINGKKTFKGSLVPSKISNKDVLMRNIGANISPSPHGIKVQSLSCSEGNVYLVDIPQSVTPPHQANRDSKYYIRLEAEAKPAPHGIVEALFFKRQKPDLNLFIHVKYREGFSNQLTIQLEFTNTALYTAENLGYLFSIDGIHQFLHFSDIWRTSEIDTGQLRHEGSPLKDGVLVNGISYSNGFIVSPSLQYIIVDCIYWCRDLQARRIVAVVDFFNGNTIRAFHNSVVADSQLPREVYEYYFLKVESERKTILKSKGWYME